MELDLERIRPRVFTQRFVKALIDTHFLLWIVTKSERLQQFPWLKEYCPWGVSPIALLELQYLSEIGRFTLRNPEFMESLANDSRFLVDEVSLVTLIRAAIDLTWTRDPFDRLIAAHSAARRIPLCTVDRSMIENHRHIVQELKTN